MTQYITKFNTEAEYEAFLNSNACPYINVSYIQETDENKYYKEEDELMMQPFTLHIDRLSNGESVPLCFFVQRAPSSAGVQSYCRYKINNNDWQTFTFEVNEEPWKGDDNIRLYEGDTVQIKCKVNQFNALFVYREMYDLQCSISGNAMSLFWGDDYVYAPADKLPLPQIPYDGMGSKIDHIIFQNKLIADEENRLLDASDLWLPTKNLPEGIFQYMFQNCVSLTAAPDIKAKYLPKNACNNMFQNCTSLTDMPNILAEEITDGAINGMFEGCTSLVNTTQLHIKKINIITEQSLQNVFKDCTSLTSVPIWNENVNIIGDWIGTNMFYGCSSLVSAENFNIRLYGENVSYYFAYWFNNCQSIEKGPKLGLVTASNNEVYLNRGIFGTDGSIVDTMYYLNALGAITCSDGDVFSNYVAANGTVYVSAGSEYLSGGSLYGQLPLGLGSGWTVAEYVEPSN